MANPILRGSKWQRKKHFPTQQVPDPAQIKPQSAADYAGRGWLYFSRQQYLEAQSDLETAISLDTNVDFFIPWVSFCVPRGRIRKHLLPLKRLLFGVR